MSTAPNPTPPAAPVAVSKPQPAPPAAAPTPTPLSQSAAVASKATFAPSDDPRPGYLTTEFWMSAFALVSTIGVSIFHWSSTQAEDWTKITNQLAPFMGMLMSFLITRQYVNQRGEIKKALADASAGKNLEGLFSLVRNEVVTPKNLKGITGSWTSVCGTVVSCKDGIINQIGDNKL
jgi:hypothetical protein